MLIKTTKRAADLTPEGEYSAALKQVTYKSENRKCILAFDVTHAGKTMSVPKDVPASFDSGPLRKDLEVLNAAEFTRQQIEDGIDPEKFVGKKCRVLVIHKRTSGGKTVAVVNVIMTLAAPVKHPSSPEPQEPAPSATGD